MPTHTQTRQAHSLIEAKPAGGAGSATEAKRYGRVNPDFAAMAGWRSGFDSRQHKRTIVAALESRSALCPECSYDLINQRRPDCPECGWRIHPSRLLYQDAPPPPLLKRSLLATVACCWVAMVVGGLTWSPLLKAVGITTLFALQLAAGWAVLTLATDPSWYRGLSTTRRRRLLIGSVTAAAIALGVVVVSLAGLLTG